MSRLGSFHDDDLLMTIEGGSRRHPASKIRQIPVPPNLPPPVPAIPNPDGSVGPLPGRFTRYRTLDPVKDAALTAAVQLTNGAYPPDPGMPVAKHVTNLAALLEPYLTGEEAHGTT